MTKPWTKHRAYLSSISRQERTLVVLRDELYEGSWNEMVCDLLARVKKSSHP